jgi:hypothetical protein
VPGCEDEACRQIRNRCRRHPETLTQSDLVVLRKRLADGVQLALDRYLAAVVSTVPLAVSRGRRVFAPSFGHFFLGVPILGISAYFPVSQRQNSSAASSIVFQREEMNSIPASINWATRS